MSATCGFSLDKTIIIRLKESKTTYYQLKNKKMKKKFLLSSIIFMTVLLSLSNGMKASTENVVRPKLVVGIVVDQMRWDYLYRYYNLYTEGGLKRLMAEGYNCENTMINYVPSVTAIGHSSVFTGSVPAIHGIAGNYFMEGRKHMYCCDDSTVQTVGSTSKAGLMSPRNMLATTIGDELKIATDFKSKVIGVALKDRASILPAGHAADAAYWFDYSACGFISSTYYMKQLPDWLVKYNKSLGKHGKEEVQYSPLGNKFTEELGKAVIENEQLGQRGVTDMLTMSFSCTDIIGHRYATHHPKTQEIYLDLDQRLQDFFTFLDKTVGKGQYLVFLTADHGAANNILFSQEHGIPAEAFFVKKTITGLDTFLKSKFNTQRTLVLDIESYKVYLDHETIDELSLSLDEVKKAAVEWLKKDAQFAYVIDLEHVAESTVPAIIKEKIVNGYFRKRSGDIQLILHPACYEVGGDKIDRGTTHGTWNPYDCHIPFILMGWGVKHGSTNAETHITDIAATVCALLHIQMPNGCIGKSVF